MSKISKYQCRDAETLVMEPSGSVPPTCKVNQDNIIWTSGQCNERTRDWKYYAKLISLLVLMVVFSAVIIYSSIMYKSKSLNFSFYFKLQCVPTFKKVS